MFSQAHTPSRCVGLIFGTIRLWSHTIHAWPGRWQSLYAVRRHSRSRSGVGYRDPFFADLDGVFLPARLRAVQG